MLERIADASVWATVMIEEHHHISAIVLLPMALGDPASQEIVATRIIVGMNGDLTNMMDVLYEGNRMMTTIVGGPPEENILEIEAEIDLWTTLIGVRLPDYTIREKTEIGIAT